MKRSILRVSLAAVAAGVMTVLLPVGSASATNQTDCGDRTDFVKVWYNGGAQTACYANAGAAYVQLPNVYRVTSGNNNIELHMGDRVLSMAKWQSIREVEGRTLYILQIR